MKTTEKEFDCIASKREGALRIYEKTKDLTLEEELAYWNERSKEMLHAIDSAHAIEPKFFQTAPKTPGEF